MSCVERVTGEGATRGCIDHAVRVVLDYSEPMFSGFAGEVVVPDVLEAHWVCRGFWARWELEWVWLEGPVAGPSGASGRREGLLFAEDGVGCEGAVSDAPGWVRRLALRARWVGAEQDRPAA